MISLVRPRVTNRDGCAVLNATSAAHVAVDNAAPQPIVQSPLKYRGWLFR